MDQLKTSVTEILEKSRVPQVEIDQYVAQFDTQEFYQQLHSRSVQGEEAILEYLDSLKTGVDFSSFESSELKTVLAEGFSQTSRFTQNQLRALERILKGTLTRCDEDHLSRYRNLTWCAQGGVLLPGVFKSEPKNKRYRSSILIEHEGYRYVVDTGPEFAFR